MSGNYKELKKMGAGAYGTVWLVEGNKTKEQYVMKKIELKDKEDDTKEKALAEVAFLKRCTHKSDFYHS